MTVDCNHSSLSGSIKTKTLDGWGYEYYEVVDYSGGGITTMMGCLPDEKREGFVTLANDALIHYNHRLPIVVYVPAELEVQYHIWEKNPEPFMAVKE